jgi:N-acetylglutamate synthase-like GNAT family acetyltransferase
MIRWLKRFFREPDRFDFPSRKRPLPECRFRPLDAADFYACAEIYRLNEPGRFPAGYFDYFSEWLLSGRDLVLVCDVAGEVRGFGGISMHREPRAELATLNFGMIHPEHHKQGYGTALLLARIATLPPPDFQWAAFISTTGGSETFFRRFGFMHVSSFADEQGLEFDLHRTRIYKEDWRACHDALAAASIALDTSDAVVPAISNVQIRKA